MPKDWFPILHEYWSRTQEARTENQRRLLARYDPEKQFMVTVSDGNIEETRLMYLFNARFWEGISTFAPKELITKIEKV